MADFLVNLFTFRVAPVGQRSSSAIAFGSAVDNPIKILDRHLSALENRVERVLVRKGDNWEDSSQSFYINSCKRNAAQGVFYGLIEVGSTGSIQRLRNAKDGGAYELKDSDVAMREFFFRIETPPDSKLGFLVIQRRGRNNAANAIHQSLRHRFFSHNLTALFRLVTDKDAFDEYLKGRLTAVTSTFVPRGSESRKTLKGSRVLGNAISAQKREDVEIKFKLNRRIDKKLRDEIREWLTSDEAKRPQIVMLPVSDDPDKLILQIEADNGTKKQLHPDMIEHMALVADLSSKVGNGGVEAMNHAAAELCADHRSALVD